MNIKPDPLAEKRRKLAKLIAEKSAAKVRFLAQNPMMDVSPRDFERSADWRRVLKDLERFDESSLDELIEYHDGSSGPRYVW